MRIALACGLCLLVAVATPHAIFETTATAQDRPSAGNVRENYRARLNENVVTIMAGSLDGTDLAIVQDLAAVLDEGDSLRVLPMVGKGPAQNVKDVMFMRGVDMGITQANILKHFAETGELGSNLAGQLVYIAKLFNEEMHVVVRSETKDLQELKGKVVNLGPAGSGTEITGRLIFKELGIDIKRVHLGEADAVEQLKKGDIDASIVVTGKPAPFLAHLKDTKGLKLLAVPYAKGLEAEYYPATLTHEDYPGLIPEGERVDTVAVCAVLVSFNWGSNNPRYKKVAKFVDRFFTDFDAFMQSPRHPKWEEVNFAAVLENWQRSPVAQAWIDKAKNVAEHTTKRRFDTFLAEAAPAAGTRITDDERARLFREFLEWSKTQGNN
jgi:TRAP transporter TAXI family solute receptor